MNYRTVRRLLATSTATALATLAVVVGIAAPSEAAVPDRFGFVLYNGAATVPAGTFPAATTVTASLPGRYRIIFPGQGAPGGVVHVTAVSPAPVWCQADFWGQSGIDEVVNVSCYRPGGGPFSTGFSAVFSRSSGPIAAATARFGYVDAQASGAIVGQYNSAGALNVVNHVGPGLYLVTMPGLGTPGPNDGSLQATAVNPYVGARCKIAKWASSPPRQDFYVACYNAAGAPFDTRFTATYQYLRAVYGGANPPRYFGYVWNMPPIGPPWTNFNSFLLTPGVNTITPVGVGLSLVRFPRLPAVPNTVQVTAFGPTANFCNLNAPWSVIGGDVIVRNVACYTSGGIPVDSGFFAATASSI